MPAISRRPDDRAAQLDAGDSTVKVTAIAKIRAMFDANKRTRYGQRAAPQPNRESPLDG